MKLQDIIKVLPDVTLDTTGVRQTKKLTRPDLVLLEQRLFEVQEGLEYKEGKGRRRGKDITTLNDIRNVILDLLETNDPHPHLRWPNVERMKKRMM